MTRSLRRLRNTFRNIRNPWAYFRYKFTGRKGPFTFLAPHGIRLQVPRRLLPTFKEIFFRDPYGEEMPPDLFRKPDITVIDVGANAGYFSFFVLSRFPKATLHAFEPFPPNFDLLRSYRDAHPQFDLHLHRKAVAGAPGTLQLRHDPDDPFSTSASLVRDTGTARVDVEAVTLEDFLASEGVGRVDWLKLDCEGAEYEIVFSLSRETLQKVRVVTVETHVTGRAGETKAALAERLRGAGFQVRVNASPLVWGWKDFV